MSASCKPSAATHAVTIIGGGAVGVTLAAMLAAKGYLVHVVGRKGPEAIDTSLSLPSGAKLKVEIPRADEHLLKHSALILVAVKAFDLEDALTGVIIQRASPNTVVLPVANGAIEGIVQKVAARRPDLLWRLGHCTFGVTAMAEEWHYALRSSQGALHFGPFLPQAAVLSAAEIALVADAPSAPPWTKGFCVWHDDIAGLQRRKWLYNTALNSLTAARQFPNNGAVLSDIPMLSAVFSEAYGLGIELWGAWPTSKQVLFEGLLALVKATADNENSMARDRRLGRRTESDFLAGLAQDQARYPLLCELHAQITAN